MQNPFNIIGTHTCRALSAGVAYAARHSAVTGSVVTLVALAALATAINCRASIWNRMQTAGTSVRNIATTSTAFVANNKTGVAISTFGIGVIIAIAAFFFGKRS